jgi:DNA polymerase III sliding clamp (beta) subunit (PCNA family)
MKTIPKKCSLPVLNNIVLSSTEKNKIVFTTNDLDQQNDTKVKEVEANASQGGFQ